MPRQPIAPKARSLRPQRFVLSDRCSGACSLNQKNLPGEMASIVLGWFNEGVNNDGIIDRAARLGVKLSNGAIGRHRANHLIREDQLEDFDPSTSKLARVNHIEMLEQIVARGSQTIHQQKISPDLALKAVEMIYRLTSGSQMESFVEAVTAAMAGGVDEDDSEYMTAQEAAQASMDDEERAQGELVEP